MPKKLHIRRGDTVIVLSGNSKGKKGRVLEIYIKKNRAIVEGANMVTKHLKPSAANPNGGIEKQGKLQRFSKKSGEFIKNE